METGTGARSSPQRSTQASRSTGRGNLADRAQLVFVGHHHVARRGADPESSPCPGQLFVQPQVMVFRTAGRSKVTYATRPRFS
ncbi:hypothetical protein ACFYMX_19520 [Streptomyces griseofuscus]|uniref:hypothetical protein n=1 Tax=Streptomyces griseofuscus TaxID=146922 RepID=UPI0036B5F6E4